MTEAAIFIEARTILDRAQRDRFLAECCGDDLALRSRVEDLLRMDAARSILDGTAGTILERQLQGKRDDREDESMIELVQQQILKLLEPAHNEGDLGRLGHYDIQELLGVGAFGVVMKAFDTQLHRRVAIKFLSPLLSQTSAPRKRFLREARSAAAVLHENVVQTYSVEERPLPYLVMEYLAGPTLQQQFDEIGPFEPEEVVKTGVEIARGLQAAHAQGIVHRDIKPGNILLQVDPFRRFKIADFGLARAVDDANRSQSGYYAGTPMYMSPEQISGELVDERSDQFSLGSVLYLIAVGHAPFRAPSTLGILKRVADVDYRPVRQAAPEVPPGLAAVIEKLLQKSPDQRFSSVAELLNALETCLRIPPPSLSTPRWRKKSVVAAGLFMVACLVMLAWRPWESSLPRQDLSQQPASGSFSPPDNADHHTLINLPDGSPAANLSELASHSAEERADFVLEELKSHNPGIMTDQCSFEISDGRIVHAHIHGVLADVRPITLLSELPALSLTGTGLQNLEQLDGSQITNLYASLDTLKELGGVENMPLARLNIWGFQGGTNELRRLAKLPLIDLNCGYSRIRDLSPISELKLELLQFSLTQIDDLSPISKMPLKELAFEQCPVTDLTPIAGMQLEMLAIAGCPIEDFSVLRNMPIKRLTISYDPVKHRELLLSIPTLELINHKPASEVLHTDSQP